jgi:predicted ATP-dependent serine protease
MIEITGGKKEQIVRKWFNDNHEGNVPRKARVKDLFETFEKQSKDEDISYGLFNGVMKKIVAEGHVGAAIVKPGQSNPDSVVEVKTINIEDMVFPNFKLHNTGKKIDELFSDHEVGGGLYGGTVNIVIGESGVGKSTVMLDMLGAIMDKNPDAKIVYVSSEMTRNDILFYHKKTPAIGKIPTVLLMDYMVDGNLDQVLEQVFNGDHDIIVLDSHQDILVKLKEAKGWKSTHAESWLIGMMVAAAENKGTAVLPIQHMTKGGTYVGSTYLKHATTAMLEIRFDVSGQRYLEFSKNRRGGSGVNKRLYYRLDEKGNVVYDTDRFKETEELRTIENTEHVRQQDLTKKFEDIFLKGKDIVKDSVEEPIVEAVAEVVDGDNKKKKSK